MAPTALPSASDTVSVDVELFMAASAAPTADDEATLKSTVASEIGVSEANIRGFTVSYSEDTRRRRQLTSNYQQRRRRRRLSPIKTAAAVAAAATDRHGTRHLASYTWTVAFVVKVSLADLDDDSVGSGSEFSSKVSEAISDELVGALQDAGVPVTGDLTVSATSSSATSDDDGAGSNDDGGTLAPASLGAAIAVPTFLVCAVMIFLSLRWRSRLNLKNRAKLLSSEQQRGSVKEFNVEATAQSATRNSERRFSFLNTSSNSTQSEDPTVALRSPYGLVVNKLSKKMEWMERRLYLSDDESALKM